MMRVNTDRIDKELDKRRWRKATLARECGMSPQWLYEIYQTGSTSFQSLDKISKALKVGVKDLLLVR